MSKQIFGQKWIILWKKWCKKVMEQECQDMVHDVVSKSCTRLIGVGIFPKNFCVAR